MERRSRGERETEAEREGRERRAGKGRDRGERGEGRKEGERKRYYSISQECKTENYLWGSFKKQSAGHHFIWVETLELQEQLKSSPYEYINLLSLCTLLSLTPISQPW